MCSVGRLAWGNLKILAPSILWYFIIYGYGYFLFQLEKERIYNIFLFYPHFSLDVTQVTSAYILWIPGEMET